MRGRAIGILLMAIFGMLPLGSLVVGAVSQRVGAPVTVLGEGIISIVLALVFFEFLTKRINPKPLHHLPDEINT
jgi:heme/copper-type cytochrome/quinol oxidase subunit 4